MQTHEHVHVVGGRAHLAQQYPEKLCNAICRGLAAQKAADSAGMFSTVGLSNKQVSALSALCCEATSPDADARWPNVVEKPIGDFPHHWGDGLHDCDGHQLHGDVASREGEQLLSGELSALMSNYGVSYAIDDVTGALLDEKLVREARALEMKFCKDMGVYTRVPR